MVQGLVQFATSIIFQPNQNLVRDTTVTPKNDNETIESYSNTLSYHSIPNFDNFLKSPTKELVRH